MPTGPFRTGGTRTSFLSSLFLPTAKGAKLREVLFSASLPRKTIRVADLNKSVAE